MEDGSVRMYEELELYMEERMLYAKEAQLSQIRKDISEMVDHYRKILDSLKNGSDRRYIALTENAVIDKHMLSDIVEKNALVDELKQQIANTPTAGQVDMTNTQNNLKNYLKQQTPSELLENNFEVIGRVDTKTQKTIGTVLNLLYGIVTILNDTNVKPGTRKRSSRNTNTFDAKYNMTVDLLVELCDRIDQA